MLVFIALTFCVQIWTLSLQLQSSLCARLQTMNGAIDLKCRDFTAELYSVNNDVIIYDGTIIDIMWTSNVVAHSLDGGGAARRPTESTISTVRPFFGHASPFHAFSLYGIRKLCVVYDLVYDARIFCLQNMVLRHDFDARYRQRTRWLTHHLTSATSPTAQCSKVSVVGFPSIKGGGSMPISTKYILGKDLALYSDLEFSMHEYGNSLFQFVRYGGPAVVQKEAESRKQSLTVPARVPLGLLVNMLLVPELKQVARDHHLRAPHNATKSTLQQTIKDHSILAHSNSESTACSGCRDSRSVFTPLVKKRKREPSRETRNVKRVRMSRIGFSRLITGYELSNRGIFGVHTSKSYELVKYTPHGVEALADGLTASVLPLDLVQKWANIDVLHTVLDAHHIVRRTRDTRDMLATSLQRHECRGSCPPYLFTFKDAAEPCSINTSAEFSARAANKSEIEDIIHDYCSSFSAEKIEEEGCAVCGELTISSVLKPITKVKYNVNVLEGYTRKERTSSEQPIEMIPGPALASGCKGVCPECDRLLEKDQIPLNALCNGHWLGEVPAQLQQLTFAEKILVARIRHNLCVVRVASGRVKMVANVVMLTNPTLKVYHALPPPKRELEEILAFVFVGPAIPTIEDFRRTPMLVRRNKVAEALLWLKMNHEDYADLHISRENLEEYLLEGVPVAVVSQRVVPDAGNKEALEMSVHDTEIEHGTSEGPCPFTVHGLSGQEYETMSMETMKAVALRHLQSQGKVLGIGHEEKPQSMYDNPQAYPQMFPWLFPYGLGGIGQRRHKGKFSEERHKRHLLMYHDKRFQVDTYFPIVAFNHRQLKSAINGSTMMAKRARFPDVVRRLQQMNSNTLIDIASRMLAGERVVPQTDDEKLCFSLIGDLDLVGGRVDGSLTSKKFMRNELWSLIAFKGSPSWFITFSPADNKHPLCLYYAGSEVAFKPDILPSKERDALIASNPVAAARFFDYMVNMFLKHILRVDSQEIGLFGKTSAYYGTVEQQGRLTLHLHMLLWIEGVLSPEGIREGLLSGGAAFQKSLIDYLETCHTGDFLTGDMETVRAKVPTAGNTSNNVPSAEQSATEEAHASPYQDPTQTLPAPPPPVCAGCDDSSSCTECEDVRNWWRNFEQTVDDLMLKSNVHKCVTKRESNEGQGSSTNASRSTPKGCLRKDGTCASRLPRPLFPQTVVDESDGHIDMKKTEPMINTANPTCTYCLRCNSDVSSLLSGTAIKAVVCYISDYITKQALKTHHIFSTAHNILSKNAELLQGGEVSNGARRVILEIVNALSTKQEIGSPMACTYLLGNKDRYTSHVYVPFYWKSFVNFIRSAWNADESMMEEISDDEDSDYEMDARPQKYGIAKANGVYFAKSNIYDYQYRPNIHEAVTLYEWIQGSTVKKRSPKEVERIKRYINRKKQREGDCDIQAHDNEESSSSEESESSESSSDFSPFNIDKAFLPGHPLHWTHSVTYTPKRAATHVPNFLGASFPRSDRGDRDFYCSAILTLFKPWRSGRELKKERQTWEESFDSTTFTTRQQAIIGYLDERHKCVDARDDYSRNRKKNAQMEDKSFPLSWNPQEFVDANGQPDEEVENLDEWCATAPVELDDRSRKFHTMRAETDEVIDRANFDQAMNGLSHVHPPPSININMASGRWKNLVKHAKEAALALRQSFYHESLPDANAAHGSTFDDVRILNAEYFCHDFKAKEKSEADVISDTVRKFQLNKDQGRAFRIVSNHAAAGENASQLLFYLGGMGGTGKSQVIRAINDMFGRRNEQHKVIMLAPTGAAAAVINGSTYHSALGIMFGNSDKTQARNDETSLREVRKRLRGVKYIFIDEVSMVACHELYAISARLAQISNRPDLPFGGFNIILAGDFAQLPPTRGKSLFSNQVGSMRHARQSMRDQEETIGKMLWHQFLKVVVLKENMRQTTQSAADAKLRTALENMRYAKCTLDDLAFLRSRIVKPGSGLPDFRDPRVRDVAVITARNIERDRINERGCIRFARDTGQTLTTFYASDSQYSQPVSDETQRVYWTYPPSQTDHVPSRLSLCRGMPVIIRNNDATELCITNGQEARVAGWTDMRGVHGERILDTLFVELHNPPKTIKVGDLPDNIVPLTKSNVQIKAVGPNGLSKKLQRTQVQVLPNFAMTDYSSQGKTRPWNIVNLVRCRTHYSYYTALSRSSSAEGTLLLDDFDARKITFGIEGHLRQEFRELELLNSLTEDRYYRRVPEKVMGMMRYPSIRAYQQFKGERFTPRWHSALNWDADEKPIKIPKSDDFWTHSSAEIKTVRASSKKGNADAGMVPSDVDLYEVPRGPKWNEKNWSCSYDSIMALLYNTWQEDPQAWSPRMQQDGGLLSYIATEFDRGTELNQIRDFIHRVLHDSSPEHFPMGNNGADIYMVHH